MHTTLISYINLLNYIIFSILKPLVTPWRQSSGPSGTVTCIHIFTCMSGVRSAAEQEDAVCTLAKCCCFRWWQRFIKLPLLSNQHKKILQPLNTELLSCKSDNLAPCSSPQPGKWVRGFFIYMRERRLLNHSVRVG